MRRLDNLIHQLNPISEQVNVIKRNKLLYHKAFANRCNNLRTAEAEVDLLGDELDLLFGLLEKIYIALDHYSPVLQHYSGVINFLFEVTFIFFFLFCFILYCLNVVLFDTFEFFSLFTILCLQILLPKTTGKLVYCHNES
ncbi:hypothetical protein B296_00037335 [Ensete ventricosum]|uniref:Uncharacterized protein n=1 Tax=Ensete ventricosum TaxID=4639 RepID=A0A426Y899_ENSVE|nr:hypothetical protein B296_00037335 [Ensete ventricosum]